MNTTLQEQRQQVENELEQEKQRGSERDNARIAELEQRQADIVERQMNDDHQGRVQQAEGDIAYILDNLTAEDADGKPIYMRDLCISENHYQLLRIVVQPAFVAQAEEGSKLLKLAETGFQEQLRAGQERESQLRRQVEQVTIERDELSRNRDNAAEQLAEAQTEVARLNSHVLDLQAQVAIGARNSIKVVTSEEQKQQIEDLAKQIHDSKIRVTNIRYKDEILKLAYLAELATTGETTEFPWIERGKYLEISNDEASQFRSEYDLANNPLDGIPTAPPLDAAVNYFPSSGESVDGESETVGSETDGDDRPVTRQEFNALKKAVDVLYIRQTATEDHLVA